MEKIDYNRKIISSAEPVLSFQNRGFHYADGLFETMRIQKKKIVFSEDHFQRLISGMQILKMEVPAFFQMEYFEQQVLKLVEANEFKHENYRAKLNVFRNAKGLYQPDSSAVAYMLSICPIKGFSPDFEKDYPVDIFPTHQIAPGVLSNLKTTSRLLNVLSGIYAKENNLKNCLLRNTSHHLAEATNGNIFVVKGQYIFTPAIEEGCIGGVLRKNLMTLIKKSDYRLLEKPISAEDVEEAEELWITNVISGIQPVTHFRTKTFSTNLAGSFMKELMVLLEN